MYSTSFLKTWPWNRFINAGPQRENSSLRACMAAGPSVGGSKIGKIYRICKLCDSSFLWHASRYRKLFFNELSPHWDPRTQAHCWLNALYLLLKFIESYLGVQPPYRGPRSRSTSLLLFVPDPSWQSPRSVSLPFPTPGIRIECVPFLFLHRICCMRESLLFLSCAACTADWIVRHVL